MAKRFEIYPKVSNPVKIAFTITTEAHDDEIKEIQPIAFSIMQFDLGVQLSRDLEWYSELGFARWSPKHDRVIALGQHCRVPPVHHVRLSTNDEPPAGPNENQLSTEPSSPRSGSAFTRPDPTRHVWSKYKHDSKLRAQEGDRIAVHNSTKKSQNLAFGCLSRSPNADVINKGFYSFHPMVCFKLRPNSTFYTPVKLVLQAYIVNIKDEGFQRLLPEHLKHRVLADPNDPNNPVFRKPCDDLSPHSRWTLQEGRDGKFFLFNQDRDTPDLDSVASRLDNTVKRLNNAEAVSSNLDKRVSAVERKVNTIEKSAEHPTLPRTQSPSPPAMHARGLSSASSVHSNSSGGTIWSAYNRNEGPASLSALKRGFQP